MKKILGYSFIGLLLVALVGSVFAYRADPTVQGPYYNEERHDLMVKAFENLDYKSWYNLKN